MPSLEPFPLRGVTGIVADDVAQLTLAKERGLSAVEVRADLLLKAGLSQPAVVDAVREVRALGLDCLFTVRHPSHGGFFHGSESDRVAFNREALAAGAQVVDAEWGTEAAATLLAEGAPVLLSHHDSQGMPDGRELAELTSAMQAAEPVGMKVVPTAATLGDAARMLAWVEARRAGETRIGFAMGGAGACSRIFTMAFGAPITYASFGDSVAPGQVALDELVDVFRAAELNELTRVSGVAGQGVLNAASIAPENAAIRAAGQNAVFVPFEVDRFDQLLPHLDTLRIDRLQLKAPLTTAVPAAFKGEGLGRVSELLVERDADNRPLAAPG